MVELREPGLLAAELELELARYRHAAAMFALPPAMGELADALARIAAMLRDAEARGQAVDLSEQIVRFIRQFRGAVAAIGGAPARA